MANKVTINTDALNITWATNTQYRFEVDENFIVEDGGSLQGLSANQNFYTFTTNSTGPVLASSIPANGSTNVTDNSQVVIIFDRKIRVNTGNIRLYKQDGTLLATFSVTDTSKVTVGDDRITIDLFGYLSFANTGYYFTADASIVKDYDGFNSVAITGSSTIAFTTGGAAAIASTSPSVNSTYVTNKTSLTITFDRKVLANTGYIKLYKVGTTDTLVKSFNVANSSEVTVSNYNVVVNVTGYIKSFQTYYFLIDAAAVTDYGGIQYAGLTDPNAIRYSTSLLLQDTFVLSNTSSFAAQYLLDGNFGYALALNDTYTLVGAPYDRSQSFSRRENYHSGGGAVSVRNTSTGAEIAYIKNEHGTLSPSRDMFGASLAISGSSALIGRPLDDDYVPSAITISIDNTQGKVTILSGTLTSNIILFAGTNTGTGSISGYTEYTPYYLNRQLVYVNGAYQSEYYVLCTAPEDPTGNQAPYDSYPETYVTTSPGTFNAIVYSLNDKVDGGSVDVWDLSSNSFVRTLINPSSGNYTYQDKFGTSVALNGTKALIGSPGEISIGTTQIAISSVDSNGKFYGDTNMASNLPYITPGVGNSPYPIEITGTKTGTGNISGYSSGNIYYTWGVQGTYPNYYIQLFANPTLWGTSFFSYVSVTTGTLTGLTFKKGIIGHGKVYVFDTNSGSLTYTIGPDGTDTGFGTQVALTDDYVIIRGSSKIFIYNSTYSFVRRITGLSSYSSFAVYGDYVVVGLPGVYNPDTDIPGSVPRGVVRVYSLSTGALIHEIYGPTPPTLEATGYVDPYYGNKVAINSKYFVVSAPRYGVQKTILDTTGTQAGRSYVYSLSDATLIATIDNPVYGGNSTGENDFFGSVTACSTNYIAITSEREDTPTVNGGAVYLFKEEF